MALNLKRTHITFVEMWPNAYRARTDTHAYTVQRTGSYWTLHALVRGRARPAHSWQSLTCARLMDVADKHAGEVRSIADEHSAISQGQTDDGHNPLDRSHVVDCQECTWLPGDAIPSCDFDPECPDHGIVKAEHAEDR